MEPNRHPALAVALGGGGPFGIAFHIATLHALRGRGVIQPGVPMIGVSAGAWAAAAFVQDIPLGELARVWAYRGPLGARPARVHLATTQVFGQAHNPDVTGVAITLPLGQRIKVDGAAHNLADVVAAASSLPVVAMPFHLDGARVYDAGVLHNTSADLAPRARTLVVLAPLGIGTLGRQGRIWERRLVRETSAWQRRHGGRVVVMRPSPRLVQHAGNAWIDIMDGRLLESTYRLALRDGERRSDEVARLLAGGDL